MTSDRTFGTFFKRVLRRGSAVEAPNLEEDETQSGGMKAATASGDSRSTTASSQVAFKPGVKDDGPTPSLRAPPSLAQGDNASVMTIASSSKRRRKSLDTNASTRAVAAESILSRDSAE